MLFVGAVLDYTVRETRSIAQADLPASEEEDQGADRGTDVLPWQNALTERRTVRQGVFGFSDCHRDGLRRADCRHDLESATQRDEAGWCQNCFLKLVENEAHPPTDVIT